MLLTKEDIFPYALVDEVFELLENDAKTNKKNINWLICRVPDKSCLLIHLHSNGRFASCVAFFINSTRNNSDGTWNIKLATRFPPFARHLEEHESFYQVNFMNPVNPDQLTEDNYQKLWQTVCEDREIQSYFSNIKLSLKHLVRPQLTESQLFFLQETSPNLLQQICNGSLSGSWCLRLHEEGNLVSAECIIYREKIPTGGHQQNVVISNYYILVQDEQSKLSWQHLLNVDQKNLKKTINAIKPLLNKSKKKIVSDMEIINQAFDSLLEACVAHDGLNKSLLIKPAPLPRQQSNPEEECSHSGEYTVASTAYWRV